MKCNVALDNFLYEQKLKNNSIETIDYYRQRIGYFIDFVCDKRVKQLNSFDYNNYLLYLKNKDIADATIKTSLTAVRVFLNFCYHKGYIKKDIVSNLTVFKCGKKTLVVLSEAQIIDIYSSFDEKSFYGSRNLLLISFMLDCGLRVSEVLDLHVDDIQTDLHIIKVRGKGNKERLVPLSDITLYYFYNYLSVVQEISSILFFDVRGNKLTTSAVRRILINLKRKLGYQKLHPHYLRHTFATYYLINGGDPLSLQVILGHSTLYMTEQYVHIAKQVVIARNVKHTPLSNIDYFKNKKTS